LNHISEEIDARICDADKLAGVNAESLVWAEEKCFLLEWKTPRKVWMIQEEWLRVPQETSRHSISILIGISLKGGTELYILEQRSAWNSDTDIQALSTALLPFMIRHYKILDNRFI